MEKKIIRDILSVFVVGGIALMLAASAGFMGYLAIRLFCHIPNLVGYLAVCGFAAAVIALAGAVAVVYMSGCWIVRKGKFAR